MRADPACHVAEHRSTDWALECARTWQCGVCMPPSAAAVKGGLVVRRSDVDPVDGDQDRSPLANSADLTDVETDRLDELEHVVARGLQTFVEVGQALGEIRDRRLYRATHGTFDNYCRERWGFVASRARQLIAAAETVTAVTAAGLPALSTEAVTREMARCVLSLSGCGRCGPRRSTGPTGHRPRSRFQRPCDDRRQLTPSGPRTSGGCASCSSRGSPSSSTCARTAR